MAAEMEKWTQNGILAIFSLFFPFRRPFFGHFRPGAIFHFFPIFFGFLRRTGFPFCRWPPRTQRLSLIGPSMSPVGGYLVDGVEQSTRTRFPSLLRPRLRLGSSHSHYTLDGPNRQSPIASVQRTRSTLAGHSAIPSATNVARMNTNRAIRIAAQRTQGV